MRPKRCGSGRTLVEEKRARPSALAPAASRARPPETKLTRTTVGVEPIHRQLELSCSEVFWFFAVRAGAARRRRDWRFASRLGNRRAALLVNERIQQLPEERALGVRNFKLLTRSNGHPTIALHVVQAASNARARALAQRVLAKDNCEAVEVWEDDVLLFMVGEELDDDGGR